MFKAVAASTVVRRAAVVQAAQALPAAAHDWPGGNGVMGLLTAACVVMILV